MGSSGRGAERRAQAAEDKRRADIRATQQRIEGIFGGPERESGIQKLISATRGLFESDIGRTKERTDRQLKFALARSGQAGGSTSVDQNRRLSESFLRATVESERRAQGAGQRLRISDQEAKLNLFSQALGGMDMTTASSNALEAMRNNIGFAQNVQSERNFDSFFSEFKDYFTTSRKAAGERRQRREFGSEYAPRDVTPFQVAGAT